MYSWLNCPTWTFKPTLPRIARYLIPVSSLEYAMFACHTYCVPLSANMFLENVIITTILEIRVEITNRLVWQDCLRAKLLSRIRKRLAYLSFQLSMVSLQARTEYYITSIYSLNNNLAFNIILYSNIIYAYIKRFF